MQDISKSTTNNILVKSWRALIVFLAVSFGVAFLSSLVVRTGLLDWYPYIEKPSFTPPSWVFSAAWSFLYSTMAIAAWRVWSQRHRRNVKIAMKLYHGQLFLNFLWTALFFGLHEPGLAFAEILLLQFSIIATAYSFGKIDKLSGYLLVPYILWVSFATALNFFIWIANY